jgi:hypothetical protein
MPIPSALASFLASNKHNPESASSLSELLRASDINKSNNCHYQLVTSTAAFLAANPSPFDIYIKQIRETQWCDSAPSDVASICAMIDLYGIGFVFCALFCTNSLCLNAAFPGCFDTRTLRVSAAYTTNLSQLVLLPSHSFTPARVAEYISACRRAGPNNKECMAACCHRVIASLPSHSAADQAIINAAYDSSNPPKSILYRFVVRPALSQSKSLKTKKTPRHDPSSASGAASASIAHTPVQDDADSADESTHIPARLAVDLLNAVDQLGVFTRIESAISAAHFDEFVVQAIDIIAASAPPEPTNLRARATATLAAVSDQLRAKRKYVADVTGVQTEDGAVNPVALAIAITHKRATDTIAARVASVAAFPPSLDDHHIAGASNFTFS